MVGILKLVLETTRSQFQILSMFAVLCLLLLSCVFFWAWGGGGGGGVCRNGNEANILETATSEILLS